MKNFSEIYNFATGPLVWVTFLVFFSGCAYKLQKFFSLVNTKEKWIFSYMSLKYSLRSLSHWCIPFGSKSWRLHPLVTPMTFVLHFCILLLPLFVSAHVMLIYEAWGIHWPVLPDCVADALTFLAVSGAIFFLLRRVVLREVRFLSTLSDFLLVIMVGAPFITAFFSYHHVLNYEYMVILHILSGELMIMAIPFTRFSHMLYALFTRSYIGSEFGGVRHAIDW